MREDSRVLLISDFPKVARSLEQLNKFYQAEGVYRVLETNLTAQFVNEAAGRLLKPSYRVR
jgi:hypothetical protein